MTRSAADLAKARALAYLRRKGTEASLDSLRKRTEQTFAVMENALAAVPIELQQARPGEGRWSPQEIADHLVESHRPGVAELKQLLAGQTPPGHGIPANLQSSEPHARPYSEVLSDLEAIHRHWLALLDSVDDTFTTDARGAIVMVLKIETDGESQILEWVERLDWKAYALGIRVHTLEHVRQLESTLAALSDD